MAQRAACAAPLPEPIPVPPRPPKRGKACDATARPQEAQGSYRAQAQGVPRPSTEMLSALGARMDRVRIERLQLEGAGREGYARGQANALVADLVAEEVST